TSVWNRLTSGPKGLIMRGKEIILSSLLALSALACARTEPKPITASAPPPAAEVKDESGRTPLMRAVDSGETEGARKLIEDGADVNAETPAGVTALMNAAGMGNIVLVELLIKKGADVNHKTSGNYTPLMQASLVGQTEIVKILLDAGADPTIKDNAGRTAADFAEEKQHPEILALLKQKTGETRGGKK